MSNGDPVLGQVGAKGFLEDLVKSFEDAIDLKSKTKLKLNFAHDYTLAIILAGL